MSMNIRKEYIDYLFSELKEVEKQIKAHKNDIRSQEAYIKTQEDRIKELEAKTEDINRRIQVAQVEIQSPLDLFIKERCILGPEEGTPLNDLFDSWELFRYKNGLKPVSKRTFIGFLMNLGCSKGTGLYIDTFCEVIRGVALQRPLRTAQEAPQAREDPGEEDAQEESPKESQEEDRGPGLFDF